MYRQIFTPTEANNLIPVTIPKEWYGMNVEVIVFPVAHSFPVDNNNADTIKKNRKRREEMLKKYSFDMSGFKFNRDEANDYD
jgi:hypothetical protein